MKTLVALGDSQTQPWGWGAEPWRSWGPVLSAQLGPRWQVRNFGVSGNTTAMVRDRVGAAMRYDQPSLGVVYAGVNDPGASIAQADTQLNIQAVVAALKHGVLGNGVDYQVHVADQTALPATGEPGQRFVCLADTSSSGGQAAAAPGQAPTVTGSATGPTVWEYRYPRAGYLGWGRIATPQTVPTKLPKIVVVTANYLNFTTGGDTLTTPYATYAPVRAAQAAAVAAENVVVGGKPSVVLADLYALMRNRVQTGVDPDFSAVAYDASASWHAQQNNQHHNAYGHALVAQAVQAAITTAGWDLAA